MPIDTETANLLNTLAQRRYFLRSAADGLTEDQARLTPTVSTLSVGGLIKHVAYIETSWIRFVLEGPAEGIDWAAVERGEVPPLLAEWQDAFQLREDETLAGVLEAYAGVAAETERIAGELESLDVSHPLPDAPWNEPGATMSARGVLAHLIGETAQHAGHADIIRETIDGKKSMG
jgi:uncharacterized damage-inducible protein DinB